MRVVDEAGITHPGAREANDDELLRLPDLSIFAVADGMGDNGEGAAAARLALEVVRQRAQEVHVVNEAVAGDPAAVNRLRLRTSFEQLFHEAGRRVRSAAAERGAVGMATTLLVVTIVGHKAYVAHVGFLACLACVACVAYVACVACVAFITFIAMQLI